LVSSGQDAIQRFIREGREAHEDLEADAHAFGHIPGLTELMFFQRPDGARAVGEIIGGCFVRYGPWRERAGWPAPWRVPGAMTIQCVEEESA
jgi:hypothetical protein